MKRALIAGINKYNDPRKNLKGCVNDAVLASKVFCKQHGFRDVMLLTDDVCTKSNILSRLEELVAATKPGDTALFFFSGHGGQVPDRDGDEGDAFDECLITHDHSWKNPLIDDDIRFCLRHHSEDSSLALVIDACHSGGMVDSPSAKVDFHPPDIAEVLLNKSPTAITKRVGRKQVAPKTQRHILFSACTADGLALERKFRNQHFGLFTHSLLNYIRFSRNKDKTWASMSDAVCKRVRRRSSLQQNPVLTCNSQNKARYAFS